MLLATKITFDLKIILVTLAWPALSRAVVMDRLRFLTFWKESELETEQENEGVEWGQNARNSLRHSFTEPWFFSFFFFLFLHNRSKVNSNGYHCGWNPAGFCLKFGKLCGIESWCSCICTHNASFQFHVSLTHTYTNTHTDLASQGV